jgi:hypothetical protein
MYQEWNLSSLMGTTHAKCSNSVDATIAALKAL